jgi:dihydroxyacetone kinase-like predicted kinase
MQSTYEPMSDRSIDFHKSDMIINKRFYSRPRTKEHRHNTQFLLRNKYYIEETAARTAAIGVATSVAVATPSVLTEETTAPAHNFTRNCSAPSNLYSMRKSSEKYTSDFGLNYAGNHTQNDDNTNNTAQVPYFKGNI